MNIKIRMIVDIISIQISTLYILEIIYVYIYITSIFYNSYFNIREISYKQEIAFMLQNKLILTFFLYHFIIDIQYKISLHDSLKLKLC